MRLKYLKHIFLFIITLTIINTKCYSQTDNLVFKHISLEDGLSQSAPSCILQDKDGFMWFGTQSGLNRYDGRTFTYYKKDLKNDNSLSDNYVYSITEDKSENIWIATQFGLNKLNKKTGRFTRYLHNPSKPESISEGRVYGVYVDRFGFVWVKTNNALNKLDTATQKFTHYEHYYDRFANVVANRPIPILEDDDGNIWAGTNDGLNLFNKQFEQFQRFQYDEKNLNSISNNIINAICFDKKGNLWIGTNQGLNKFNLKRKTFTRFYNNPKDPNSISGNNVTAIFMDYKGFLWFGTTTGLNKYNESNNKFIRYIGSNDNPDGLNNSNILAIYQDFSKNLWIGTFGGGLNKFDMKSNKFQVYRRSKGANSIPLSENNIYSIYVEDNNKTIWIGTLGGGINIYNRETGLVEYINKNTSPERRILNDDIHALFKDSNGMLWIGTKIGISIYNKSTKQTLKLSDYIKKDLSITTRVNAIFEDKNKNVWIGTVDQGLFMVNIQNYNIKAFTSKKNKNETINHNSLASTGIYSIIEDKNGYIWIGTDNGLNKYDPYNDKFSTYRNNPNDQNSISGDVIIEVFEAKDETIWIGTTTGLNKYNKNKNNFTYYTEKDGLPEETVYDIEEDAKGNLWFSTNRGIARFDVKKNIFRSFKIGDGLQSLEFNNGTSFKTNKGELFFGGINGFNSFYPDSMSENYNIPPIVITSIEKINNLGKQEIYKEGKNTYLLTYKDHTITIEFAALEYTDPMSNNYAYMMEGLKDEWFDCGNRNAATFSNLPPGEYKFKVKGSNNDLVWNDRGIEINIIVKPPFWSSIWAYTFYGIIIFSIIFSIIKMRTRKLRNANEILREKQLAALEIAKQKEVLTIKNKSITDSINYAKRIQVAMMPSEFLFKKHFPESFVLYKPKDIVSGDFYWIMERNNKIFIAAVDCTGHGVPGAFMSIIGFDLLRNITKDRGIENPAQILDELNKGVSDTFSKNVDNQKVKDGMDIALCVINKNNNTIEYAGAFNPLYLIRDNNIIEIHASRFSVGMLDDVAGEKFDYHVVPIQPNDMVYLFTDGYPDQFGGPLGKKFKFRRFRHLLSTIHNLPLSKQKAFLDENIENWRGELEQVDDILVIGLKL